ncbi:MAG: PIG-L family deacetylase [Alphaproteobacteria bacterium]|nr:PIG-L family deacetylase [Alphaproteobacteria bacterium]
MGAPDDISGVVSSYVQLVRRVLTAPDVAPCIISETFPAHDPSRPCALLFSPHPDDECLTGALALRLAREQGWQVVNVAITLGSDATRRALRKAELARACAVLGFDCMLPAPEGFSNVTAETRAKDAKAWAAMVARCADIIARCKPQAVFLPHEKDAHPAHVGTHVLAADALAAQGAGFECAVFETEYWQPNETPNYMVGVGEEDVATLLSALSCPAGENARNPFDARFPAYLIDNVRRGAERVGCPGASAPAMDFAVLYRYGVWKNGRFMPSALGRAVGADEPLRAICDT